MAKDGAPNAAADLEELIKDGRKKPLNFALMKTKDGVVLKAHPLKGCEVMARDCKAEGGMPAISCTGIMNVSGKLITLQAETDDVPSSLPKLAKRHFAALGLPMKVQIVLPSGGTLDDEETPEGTAPGGPPPETETVAEGIVAPVEEESGLKDELTQRLKELVPQVKDAVASAIEGADKLATAAKAAASELASGGFDRAKSLLDAIDKGLRDMVAQTPGVDPAALKQQMQSEFDKLGDSLRKLVETAAKEVSGKANGIAQMFRTELERDLKKAASALGLLKQYIETELGKLAKSEAPQGKEGIFDDLLDLVGLGGSSEPPKTGSGTPTPPTGPTETTARATLTALGLTGEALEKAVEAFKKDPQSLEKVKKERLDKAGVPADRQAALMTLADKSPKAFAEALKSLEAMETGGKVDITPDALTNALTALETAQRDVGTTEKAASDAVLKAAEAQKAHDDAGLKLVSAREELKRITGEIDTFRKSIGDLKTLTPEQRKEAAEKMKTLLAEQKKAQEALEKTIEDRKKATKDLDAANDTQKKTSEAAQKARDTLGKSQKTVEAQEGKKALVDALSFGPLAPGNTKMSDEDKAKFAAAFGKNARVANAGLGVAANAKDPAAVAANVGLMADKANDGFAAADGRKLAMKPAEIEAMAANALRMGGEMGPDYFKGFDEYLKSGKQLEPDPQGGLDAPKDDPKEETKRKNKVALARTQAMSGAAIKPDGTVDFDSPEAKAAMDHMMFHPGSLTTFTPQMNAKMAETKGLFANPGTKDKANKIIADTKLPTSGPGQNAAKSLVAGTTGKDKGAIGDNDAKASVLSAMMTPMSQGPVGSCFSTAPVRAIRETDPLRAMDQYSKIATTGQFTAKNGLKVPANTKLPEGENPLMRSWEYSVASAAAETQGSIERNQLTEGLFGGNGTGQDFSALSGIVDNYSDSWGLFSGWTEGVETKIKKAIASDLKFDYNAGPPVGGASPTGGGDGHSSQGAYEILYKGKPIKSEAEFVEAMKDIALKAAGETATSDTGKKIVALVSSAGFKNSVLAANGGGYKPWELSGGGFEKQTAMVLDGGKKENKDVLGANSGTPPQNRNDRTKAVLGQILNTQKGAKGDFVPLGTTGKNANHAFNTLPNHPSLDLVKDPGSTQKIEDNLVKPGQAIASGKLPVDQAQKMFEEQLKALMAGKGDTERDLILAALKNRPTAPLTPSELKAKVATELAAYRDAVAQRRLDVWFDEENKKKKAKGEVEMGPGEKPGYLQWFKDNTENGIKADFDNKLQNELAPPVVVVADTNWGGPAGQTYFVVAPDVMTGELKMWKQEQPSGKLTPLGENWTDAKFDTVK